MMFAPTFALVLGLMPISATSSPYDIDPLTEGLLTGGLLVWSFLADGLIKDDVYRQPACRHRPDETICDPDQLNALDRTVVGNDSKTWRLTSDVVGIGTLALPFALEAVDVWLSDSETGASDYMTDLLVVTEAVALTTFITGLTKWAVARPRPTQYSELTDNKYGLPEHQRSFPSGHTSSATAAAVAEGVLAVSLTPLVRIESFRLLGRCRAATGDCSAACEAAEQAVAETSGAGYAWMEWRALRDLRATCAGLDSYAGREWGVGVRCVAEWSLLVGNSSRCSARLRLCFHLRRVSRESISWYAGGLIAWSAANPSTVPTADHVRPMNGESGPV